MIELSEKDVKVVGNARFFRKWKWHMVASILPFAVAFAVCWGMYASGDMELTMEEGIILVGGSFILIMVPAMYWDIRQRRAVRAFVEDWKETQNANNSI